MTVEKKARSKTQTNLLENILAVGENIRDNLARLKEANAQAAEAQHNQTQVLSVKLDELTMALKAIYAPQSQSILYPPQAQLQQQTHLPRKDSTFAGFTRDELDALPWRQYPNERGAWVFATQKDGAPSENQVVYSLVKRIREEGQRVIFGKTYKLSLDGKFLSRSPP